MLKKIIITGLLLIILIFIEINLSSKKDALVLMIDFGNGNKKVFYNYAEKERTAWGLLQQVAIASELELKAGEDFWPQKIDGLKNGDENKIWSFYINGVRQMTSPINIKVNIPDKVTYKFE